MAAKKRHFLRKLITFKKSKDISPKGYKMTYVHCMFVVIVVIMGYFFFGIDIKCSDNFSPLDIINKLQDKLYGQPEAVEGFRHAFFSKDHLKIITITGGTGQGKTYASQIIFENIEYGHNIQRFVMKSLYGIRSISNIQRVVSQCRHNLIIIDDLNLEDISESVYIIDKLLTGIDRSTIRLDIVLIFNIEKVSKDLTVRMNSVESLDAIHGQLQMLDIPMYSVKFEKMSTEDVRKCVEEILIKSNLNYSEDSINKVMDVLQTNIDGCKDVYAKVSHFYQSLPFY